MTEDIDEAIREVTDALGAVRLVRKYFASVPEAASRIEDICQILEATEKSPNVRKGLRTYVAEAIRKSYL